MWLEKMGEKELLMSKSFHWKALKTQLKYLNFYTDSEIFYENRKKKTSKFNYITIEHKVEERK